jgi:hypothetical protein
VRASEKRENIGCRIVDDVTAPDKPPCCTPALWRLRRWRLCHRWGCVKDVARPPQKDSNPVNLTGATTDQWMCGRDGRLDEGEKNPLTKV